MKPLCNLCGSRHNKNQSHQFVANTGKSVEGMRVELWRDGNRERYNARMREYMRKRRSKVKFDMGLQIDSVTGTCGS